MFLKQAVGGATCLSHPKSQALFGILEQQTHFPNAHCPHTYTIACFFGIIHLLFCPIQPVVSNCHLPFAFISPRRAFFLFRSQSLSLAMFSFVPLYSLPRSEHSSIITHCLIRTLLPTLHSSTPPRRADMPEIFPFPPPIPSSFPSFPLFKSCYLHKARTQPGQRRARSLPP